MLTNYGGGFIEGDAVTLEVSRAPILTLPLELARKQIRACTRVMGFLVNKELI